ncbi:type VII secretion protein EccB [Microbacterium sp. P01]|uniref:type VII secretion protein EccB n=1 Tax=Microbacterium sp. P01 TaxID=3366261 RepID=UPI00366F5B04
MATKNDLIEAQNFSRRRLLTAFVSGAPGGKELEPAAPLRAVFAAIALTAAVLLVGVFWGLIQPGLPNGWQNGRLVLAKDTGARYVSIEGALHPVINTASARLLIPSSDFAVISTDQNTLAGVPLDSTLGIVGAPDSLPSPSNLIGDGWTACVADDAGTDVRIATDAAASATRDAAVVEASGALFVVAGEQRFAVDPTQSDAVLRAAGITSLDPAPVSASWLNLFTPGADLSPIVVTNAGLPLEGSALSIGDVVHIGGDPEDVRYVILDDGTLAELTPLAWQLYQLGSGQNTGTVSEVTAAEARALPTARQPAGGADWPRAGFTSIDTTTRACALLTHDAQGAHTVLATQPTTDAATAGVRVQAGHGALVAAGGRGDQSTAMLTLVDATGTAYALPGATEETIKRLGYDPDADVGSAGQDWIALLASGPALTEAAAGTTPGTAAQ